MSTVVLVPRRADHGRRDAIWNTLATRWRQTRFTFVEGHHYDGPFNRSAALNRAAAGAPAWTTAIIADADSWVHAEQLNAALRIAEREQRMVIAHSRWVNVDVDETDDWIAGYAIEHRDHRLMFEHTVSSILVVPRTVWDAVNGFDERFQGWGWEDRAFARACRILTGAPLRVHGDVFHLAHDRPIEDTHRRESTLARANESRWRQYQGAHTPEMMRRITEGNRL